MHQQTRTLFDYFIFHFLQSLCLAGAGSCHHLGPVFVNSIFGSDWKLQLGPLTEEAAGEKRQLLGRILSELISEYRAIFEIESTIEHIVHECTDTLPIMILERERERVKICPQNFVPKIILIFKKEPHN